MVEIDDLLSPDRCARPAQRQQAAAVPGPRGHGRRGDRPRPDHVLAALSQREKLGTTGIGEGIAIPHARVKQLTGMTGFFARMATPVDYDALDDAPVDLVFLLLAPEDANAMQLKALARIARLLRDPEVCAQLRRETDPEARPRPARRPAPGAAGLSDPDRPPRRRSPACTARRVAWHGRGVLLRAARASASRPWRCACSTPAPASWPTISWRLERRGARACTPPARPRRA